MQQAKNTMSSDTGPNLYLGEANLNLLRQVSHGFPQSMKVDAGIILQNRAPKLHSTIVSVSMV